MLTCGCGNGFFNLQALMAHQKVWGHQTLPCYYTSATEYDIVFEQHRSETHSNESHNPNPQLATTQGNANPVSSIWGRRFAGTTGQGPPPPAVSEIKPSLPINKSENHAESMEEPYQPMFRMVDG